MLEIDIPLRSRLRGVERINPAMPLAPAAPVVAARAAPAPAAHDLEQDVALSQLLKNLSSAARDLQAQYRQRLVESEKATVQLAVAIAGRLIHEKLAASEFAVEKLVHKVVERLETREPVTVFLHPLDLALLEQRLQGQPNPWGMERSLTFAAAAAMGRGCCRAEAGEWRVDAQLDVQLADIRDRLLRSVGQGGQPLSGKDRQ